jgi:hypothetical protein
MLTRTMQDLPLKHRDDPAKVATAPSLTTEYLEVRGRV